MPAYQDYTFTQGEDGKITIGLSPPFAIGGMSLRFLIQKRAGGISGIYQAYCGSGFVNVSGLNIVDSGQGIVTVSIPGTALSGYDAGNYFFSFERLDSGNRTVLAQGYESLQPGVII